MPDHRDDLRRRHLDARTILRHDEFARRQPAHAGDDGERGDGSEDGGGSLGAEGGHDGIPGSAWRLRGWIAFRDPMEPL